MTTRTTRRWAAPLLALAAVAGVSTIPRLISSASADTPNLPAITPAELIAKAESAQVTALSGTIVLTSDLGLPSLGALGALGGGGASSSLASLLSGDHTARVWIDGPEHVRLATLAPMAETNWIRNGQDLWSYDSTTLTATHVTLPTGTPDGTGTDATPDDPARGRPDQLAQRLLDAVTPSTQVSVDSNARVAGRAVYRLVLRPNDAHSTVGEATISVDAETGLPLQVALTSRDSGSTALRLGFSAISFSTPSASEFAFSAPPGATVIEATDPTALLAAGADPHTNERRHGRRPGIAATVEGPAPASTARPTLLGHDWLSAVLLAPSSMSDQLSRVLSGSPEVTVGTTHGRVLTTTLFTVLVLDDGRIAIGAVDTETLVALVATA